MKRTSKPTVRYIAQKNIFKNTTGDFIQAGTEWPSEGAPPDEIQMHLDNGTIRAEDIPADEAAPIEAQEAVANGTPV